jgi:hypothetical protein
LIEILAKILCIAQRFEDKNLLVRVVLKEFRNKTVESVRFPRFIQKAVHTRFMRDGCGRIRAYTLFQEIGLPSPAQDPEISVSARCLRYDKVAIHNAAGRNEISLGEIASYMGVGEHEIHSA